MAKAWRLSATRNKIAVFARNQLFMAGEIPPAFESENDATKSRRFWARVQQWRAQKRHQRHLKKIRKRERRAAKRNFVAQKKHDKQQRRAIRKTEKQRRRQLLQSKLTRSYLRVTVASVVAIELIIGGIAALIQRTTHARDVWAFAGTVFWSTVIVGIFASIVGAGFGWFIARQLTRRLEAIEAAAVAWGQGEFGVVAPDETPDEIGRLARRLNAMAQELRELVTLRQDLATAEERNRLSRELHDTVKQQVFATSMQIGAAKLSLANDVAAARERLNVAEQLARGAQSELTTILEQLRPGSYDVPVLSNSIENTREVASWRDIEFFAREWAQQNAIALQLEAQNTPVLTEHEHQMLLRIVQESLSNVVRHSGATQVRIALQNDENNVWRCAICDDGRGFDQAQIVSRGMGLRNMRERAESLNQGRFCVQSSENGTTIEVCWESASR